MRLKVEPDVVALAPGDVTDLLVRLHNDGEEPCTPHLQVRGVDPDDVLLPDEVVAVPAGSVMTAVVRVRAAADAVPGDQRISVAAHDLDGIQSTVSTTTVLRIGARPDVAVEVDPVATAGRRGAKARTVLRNRSDRRLQVDLEGRGEGVRVAFRPSRVTLDPGETKRVPTRLRRAQRSWFGEIRHGAVITARGIGVPASTTATFTQKPSVPRPAVRGVAALTALAVWVAATVVVFNRINAEPEAGPDSAVVAAPAAPGPGRTSATGMFEEDVEEGVRLPVVIQGTIEGPRDPSGTTVTAERIGFGDQGTTTGLTKVVALTEVKIPRGNVLDVVRTTTDERGRFRIASGLVEDAFYRVTAVRAGFEVGSFIVSTSADEPEVTLAVALEPATGALAGTVKDTDSAPIGGATVVVTDGSAEYTTVTPSDGADVGRWALEGLATPATYQVLVSRRGFAAQTLIVELDGGRSLEGIDAVLTADLGTIVGRITDANPDPNQPGVAQGVGALTVTVAGPEARETRTLTVAGDLRGTFDLPGLPYGDYTITFAGDGWETRQAEVTVDRGLVRLDATVNRSTGLVQGYAWQVATGPTDEFPGAFQGACRYPRNNQRVDAEATAAGTRARPCGGVSVTVESDEGDVFATATATDTGFFQIGGVPAGEYTLTLSRPGYVSDVRSIRVQPGGTFDLNPDREPFGTVDAALAGAVDGRDFVTLGLAAAPAACAGSVLLTLIDFRDGTGVDPVTDASAPGVVTVSNATECDPALTISPVGTSGSYLLQNVPLGPQTITVGGGADVWAYESVNINVQVSALDRVAVTQNILPRPRTLTLPAGTIRMDGPAAASRDVTLEVINASGTNVGEIGGTTITLSGNSTNAQVDLELVGPDRDLRLRAVGSSEAGYETVTSASFELPPGTEPFELPLLAGSLPRLSLVATTTVTGRIFGFSASPLALSALEGATVTFPAQSRPAGADGSSLSVTTKADGTFDAVVRAGTYLQGASPDRTTGAFGAILVSASGYATRTFNPPGAALALTGATTVLRDAGTSFFLLYGDPDRAAGDVGLDPVARDVSIPVRLLGGAGVTRTLTATLESGSVPLTPAVATDPTDISSSPLTLTVLAGSTSTDGNLQFTGVPVGTYQLRISGDDVVERLITGIEVPPGDPADAHVVPGGATSRAVQATTNLTLTVSGGFPALSPLADATVTFPADTLLEGSPTTGADGSISVTVKAGTYGTSGATFGPVEVERAGFVTDSAVALSLANPATPNVPVSATITLEPAPRDLSGTVDLTVVGGASVSRTGLTARLFELDGDGGDRVAPAVVIDADAPFDSSGSFVFVGVPVGFYELEVSGTGIEQGAPRAITVPSGTETEDLGATTVRATTEVTGIVRDLLDDGSTDTFVGLEDRTVRFKGGGATGDATVATDASGVFALTVTAGTYEPADAVVKEGGGYLGVGMGTTDFTATTVDVGVLEPAPAGTTFRLTGTVVSDPPPGSAVASIVATAEGDSSNTRNAVLDATTPAGSPGSYVLDDLDYGIVWRIEFRATGGAVLATRWVDVADPGSAEPTTQVMNQDVRSGSFATVTATIDNPTGVSVQVRATLTERGPFPTIAATGALERTVTVAANGSGEVVFDRIPIRDLAGRPAADASILIDRFTADGGVGGLTFEILTVADGWEPLARADIPDTLLDDVTVPISRTLVPRAERAVLEGPATLDAGEVGTFTLGIEDASGAAAVIVENTTFTLATDTAPGDATFSPSTVTIPAGSSSITFTYANTDVGSGTHAVSASRSSGFVFDPAASGDVSADVTVEAAAPSRLTFETQPTATAAGQAIDPAPTVRIEDVFGNLAPSTASVTITPSGVTLSGASTTTVNAVGGVATFSALTPSTGASGATLTAASGTLTSATSSSFDVTVPAATGVTATTATESIVVTWDPPSGVTVGSTAVEVRSGGSVVTERPLGGGALSCDESAASPKDLTVPGAGRTCTIAGLTDGTIAYTASVTVTSGGESSAASDLSSPAVTPTVTTTTASVPAGCTSSDTQISCTATGSRTITFTTIKNNASIRYLIVGGGGGGGNDGGGGGGGGGVSEGVYSLTGKSVTALSVMVGAGGAGAVHGGTGSQPGSPSSLSAGTGPIDEVLGGSAGTGGLSGRGDGFGVGGAAGGGGSGGGVGNAGDGGASSEDGEDGPLVGGIRYGGGGGGGSDTGTGSGGGDRGGGAGGFDDEPPTAGEPNTGGGGGGGAHDSPTSGNKNGGSGGSGIVIIELNPS